MCRVLDQGRSLVHPYCPSTVEKLELTLVRVMNAVYGAQLLLGLWVLILRTNCA